MDRSDIKGTIDQIKTDKRVIRWLDGLNPSTQVMYLQALGDFCQVVGKQPTELLEIAYKEIEDRTPPWELQIEGWFEEYRMHGIRMGRSPRTCASRKTTIRSFFHFYKIPTPKENIRRDNQNTQPKNIRDLPTKEDLRIAIDACKSYKLKALILCQSSSGLAASDILGLNVKQFNEGLVDVGDGEICKLRLKRKKTGKEFITFLSHEAVEMVKSYLKFERNTCYGKSPLFLAKPKGNKRFTAKGYIIALNRLNQRLEWDNEKWRYGKLTSHMLRKFFNSQLIYAGMPEEIREHLMGHTIRDKVRDAYYLTNEHELQNVYTKYLKVLSINDVEAKTVGSPGYMELKAKLDDIVKTVDPIMRAIKEDPAVRKAHEEFIKREINKETEKE